MNILIYVCQKDMIIPFVDTDRGGAKKDPTYKGINKGILSLKLMAIFGGNPKNKEIHFIHR